jgi:2-keto-3-deoxy-L-rhamnonate aldolase RhmA
MKRAAARLRSREPVFGVMQLVPVPTVTELAVWSGSDFIVLDCQYGAMDELAHLAALQLISGSDALGCIRVRPGDLGAVGRYLDFGADAIMLPDVSTAADAAAFVAAATHGPTGTRSSTGSGARAARYGMDGRSDLEKPLLLAIIESAEAVANIAAIAATPGLGGLVIGPNDLSANLGSMGDFSTPAYISAFTTVEQAASRAGLILGSSIHSGFGIERLLQGGHCFILAGSDVSALRDGFGSQLAAVGRRKKT